MVLGKKVIDVYIFFLVVFALNFFSAKFATTTGVIKYISYAFLLCSMLVSLPFFFKERNRLVVPIQMISVSIVLSVIMSYISWGQGFSYAVSTLPYTIWFSFFFLMNLEYPIYKIERIIMFYGLLYIILYLFQLMNSNVVYFGFREEFVEDRGIVRIDFPGGGVFFLSFFIALCKFTEKNKYRWAYMGFCIVCIVVTILQVTRQSIAIVLVVTLFHLLTKVSFIKKILIVVSFASILLYFFNSDNPISRGLIEKQKETSSEGKDYIRILAADYFINDFSPNAGSSILGNGIPNNTSNYGKYVLKLQETYGYFASDLGLIGCYSSFGIFAVLGIIILFVNGVYFKIPSKYQYLKYYIYFLIFTCFTSDYSYSSSYIITTIFVIYCFNKINRENKIINMITAYDIESYK